MNLNFDPANWLAVADTQPTARSSVLFR